LVFLFFITIILLRITMKLCSYKIGFHFCYLFQLLFTLYTREIVFKHKKFISSPYIFYNFHNRADKLAIKY